MAQLTWTREKDGIYRTTCSRYWISSKSRHFTLHGPSGDPIFKGTAVSCKAKAQEMEDASGKDAGTAEGTESATTAAVPQQEAESRTKPKRVRKAPKTAVLPANEENGPVDASELANDSPAVEVPVDAAESKPDVLPVIPEGKPGTDWDEEAGTYILEDRIKPATDCDETEPEPINFGRPGTTIGKERGKDESVCDYFLRMTEKYGYHPRTLAACPAVLKDAKVPPGLLEEVDLKVMTQRSWQLFEQHAERTGSAFKGGMRGWLSFGIQVDPIPIAADADYDETDERRIDMSKGVKVKRATIRTLLVAVGYSNADEYDDAKLLKRIEHLKNDKEEDSAPDLDAASRKLMDRLIETVATGGDVVFLPDDSTESEGDMVAAVKEKKPKAAKAKPEAKAGKATPVKAGRKGAAKAATNGKAETKTIGKRRTKDVLGHSASSALRWMGEHGWTLDDARTAMEKLGVAEGLSKSSIGTCLAYGRARAKDNSKYPREPAKFTKDQIVELKKLVK